MTYCIGIKLKSGLVALSDTRVTSGNETTTAEKYKVYSSGEQKVFLMTSGLRSVRDKTLTYFSEVLNDRLDEYDKLYQVVNALGDQIKRVWKEDRETLTQSGLAFNINTIVGGKLSGDKEHQLYLLYPQGNWIEIGEGSPFTIIGNSGYGTPVLRRTVSYDSSIRFALKTSFLSFDSTRVSCNDVGYPIDIIIFSKKTGNMEVKRLNKEDMADFSKRWGEKLTAAVNDVSDDWINTIVTDEDE